MIQIPCFSSLRVLWALPQLTWHIKFDYNGLLCNEDNFVVSAPRMKIVLRGQILVQVVDKKRVNR